MGGRGGASPATDRVQGPRGPQAPAVINMGLTNSDQVIQAYRDLQRHPGDWVPLADLRERLSAVGMSRDQQDAAIIDLETHTSEVNIIPWDNRKVLRPRDHAAALEFGGQENHAIRIDFDR